MEECEQWTEMVITEANTRIWSYGFVFVYTYTIYTSIASLLRAAMMVHMLVAVNNK